MSVLEKLTEGIVNRDLQKEGTALLNKWEKTGLLEGIGDDAKRQSMSRLLENQARELLREASSMAAGDVEGFAAVAFPIVRRVFGSLIANDLVSVQPMSLPSGLIFFLDFQKTDARNGGAVNDSLYGGGVVGQAITGGVDLKNNAESGFYNLNNGYASPTGSATFALNIICSGVVGSGTGDDADGNVSNALIGNNTVATSLSKLVRYDPDLSGSAVIVCAVTGATSLNSGDSLLGQLQRNDLVGIAGDSAAGAADGASSTSFNSTLMRQVRRVTTMVGKDSGVADANVNALALTNQNSTYLLAFQSTASVGASSTPLPEMVTNLTSKRLTVTFPINDNFGGTATAGSSNALGAVVGTSAWDLEAEAGIPEIDIKVDSVSVTAQTKKLKAKWTPELGQDLNAYHNLDAEVELTGILSEQIALEIDREILEDLVKGSTAGTLYWSRRPGKFLDRERGTAISTLANESLLGADFTGTVSEWYETLVETINDVSARIHRKTLRGGANFIVVAPEVANILEFTSGFRADVTGDTDRGTVGTVKTGSLSKKWDVYVDPYFPRNLVLVGRKGGSFLESGYVYAPYVPLQVTPTIFGVEDFVPRKGVMTRYAKKMVRPDMYGLVVVTDLLG